MVSGGLRPGAPQNNPANISATGGAGQSGAQPSRYISGLPYGQGQATMAQQGAAPMAKAATPQSKPSIEQIAASSGLNTLFSPTDNPTEPVTAGASVGAGPGPEVLPGNLRSDRRPIENKEIIQKYIPTLLAASSIPDAPDSYKKFVNYLLGEV